MGKKAARLGDIGSGHGAYPPTPIVSGSSNVLTNNRPAARLGDSVLLHAAPKKPPHGRSIAAGSSTVFINGKPASRVGDGISCGGSVSTGSGNVEIGDSPQFKKPYTLPPVKMPWDQPENTSDTNSINNVPTDIATSTSDGTIINVESSTNDTDVRIEGQSAALTTNKPSAIKYWADKKQQADDFPTYLAAHLMGLNAETGYSIAEGLQATYETVTDWDKFKGAIAGLADGVVDTVSDPMGTYQAIKDTAQSFSDLPLSEQGEALYKGGLGLLAGGGASTKALQKLGQMSKANSKLEPKLNPKTKPVKSFADAELRLEKARDVLKERKAAGLTPYQAKYTDAELQEMVESDVIAQERFLVSVQPKNTAPDATLAYQKDSGLVTTWTTSVEQLEAADKDPKLIHQVLGIESNYHPNKEYVMHIIDRGENLENYGNNTIVPTWDNLADASIKELGDSHDPEIIRKTMNEDYQREYAKKMDNFWRTGSNEFLPNDIEEFTALMDEKEADLFLARHNIRTEIGANSEFRGDGLTDNKAEGGGKFGVVETLNIERNLPNLSELQSRSIVKTIDLTPL